MNTELNKKNVPTLYGSIKKVPQVDKTLTKEGYFADAKAVGDILRGEQRAVNFSYDSNDNGLKAETIQEAIDELKSNADGLTQELYNTKAAAISTQSDLDLAESEVDELRTDLEELKSRTYISPENGIYYGFSIYSANKVAGLFIPLDNYILKHYTIAVADKILFSGIVEGYTADEVTVKNNGVFVGHTFATAQEALNAIKATSGVNGTTRLTFSPK